MNRVCDTGAICQHTPQCEHFCHFTNAELEPEVVRKIKPYPVIPEDIEPVPQAWQMVGSVVVGFVLVALMVVVLLLFFTGLWVWSLLI
jgi:multisubunit Na+/H+ antiporter MnhC subunit